MIRWRQHDTIAIGTVRHAAAAGKDGNAQFVL